MCNSCYVVVILIAVGALAWPNVSFSQTASTDRNGTTPARIGNIWNGLDHQPTPAELNAQAKADHVPDDAAEQKKALQDIYAIDRELLGQNDNLPAPQEK
jgi:hypothetical protein